eukprot:351287-Amphidinium_carterae.1
MQASLGPHIPWDGIGAGPDVTKYRKRVCFFGLAGSLNDSKHDFELTYRTIRQRELTRNQSKYSAVSVNILQCKSCPSPLLDLYVFIATLVELLLCEPVRGRAWSHDVGDVSED